MMKTPQSSGLGPPVLYFTYYLPRSSRAPMRTPGVALVCLGLVHGSAHPRPTALPRASLRATSPSSSRRAILAAATAARCVDRSRPEWPLRHCSTPRQRQIRALGQGLSSGRPRPIGRCALWLPGHTGLVFHAGRSRRDLRRSSRRPRGREGEGGAAHHLGLGAEVGRHPTRRGQRVCSGSDRHHRLHDDEASGHAIDPRPAPALPRPWP